MAKAGFPLVTIVTPTFNQAAFLERTIHSVLAQDYPRIEYIIVDGASTDGTAAILRRYAGCARIVSEPDDGQADAINKGFRLASGDILGWLNSDDLYLPGAISAVVRAFRATPSARFIYRDALAMDAQDRLFGIRSHVRQTDHDDLLRQGDFIVQPAAFWRMDLWREIGELNPELYYTLDYDYWLRASQRTDLRYLPVVLAAERLYAGAKTGRGAEERMNEIEQLARQNGLEDVPEAFRAQQAAQLASGAVRRLLRLDPTGWPDLRRAWALNSQRGAFLRYFAVTLLLGEASVARFWLLLNLFRQRQKADTVLPDDFLTADEPPTAG